MKKILVVDDDEDILEAVKCILTMHHFDVKTHTTGLNVTDIVQRYHPDLILLDIRLPGKLGTEVCKELKQIYAGLPVILFSAHSKQEKLFTICDAFIQKPFEVKHLIESINLHVN